MAGNELLIGTAIVDITPPLGHSLAGYFKDRKAEGICDPLYVHAIVIECGKERIAWITADLLAPGYGQISEIRAEIERTCGIPGSHVMMCCTHCHTGPLLPREFVKGDSEEHAASFFPGETSPSYVGELNKKIIGAVAWADRAKAPVGGIGWAVGHEDGISFNRRYWMNQGGVKTNPGRLNPDIEEAAAPIDPSVNVVTFGDPPQVIVNFACHPDVVGGNWISADYPGFMRRTIRRVLGDETQAFFFQGCAGDINHIGVSKPTGDGHEHARWMGTILGAEAARTALKADVCAVSVVGAAAETLDIPIRQVTSEELAKAESILSDPNRPTEWPEVFEGTPEQIKMLDALFAESTVALARAKEKSRQVEVQAMRVGEAGIVGLPGEIFVEHGLKIKAESPFPLTIVCELANEWHGYIPTQKAFSEGGYEIRHKSARLAEDAGDRMVEAALRLLESLDKQPDS